MPRPRRARRPPARCSATSKPAAWFLSTAPSCRSCPTSRRWSRGFDRFAGRGAGRRRSGARRPSRQARAGKRCRGRAQYRADGRRRRDPRRGRLDHRAAAASCFVAVGEARRDLRALARRGGKGARAMLIESHEGPAGSDYQVNAALELFVGDEAHVDHVKIIGEGSDALHVSTLAAAIGAMRAFNTFTFTAGGAVVRNQLFLKFDGEGTVAGIRGATLLKGRSTPTPRWSPITSRAAARAGRCSSRCSTTKPTACSRAASSCARRAEDRRQDDDAGAAAFRPRRGRQQAGARNLCRRRAVRPRRHRRRARRGA
jgi:hypothetical protein